MNAIEKFRKSYNPQVYTNNSDSRWKKYIDIGRWSRLYLSLKQCFVLAVIMALLSRFDLYYFQVEKLGAGVYF
jgi:hypothetical protein